MNPLLKQTIASHDSDEASLYVTTYGLYNEGLQFASENHSFWINVEDYTNLVDEITEHFEQLTGQEPEIMFTAYENFPSDFYSESCIDFDKLEKWLELEEDEKEALQAIMDLIYPDIDEAMDKLEDCYIFEGTGKEYAEEYASECLEIPDHLARYICYNSILNDLDIDGTVHEISYHKQLICIGGW